MLIDYREGCQLDVWETSPEVMNSLHTLDHFSRKVCITALVASVTVITPGMKFLNADTPSPLKVKIPHQMDPQITPNARIWS